MEDEALEEFPVRSDSKRRTEIIQNIIHTEAMKVVRALEEQIHQEEVASSVNNTPSSHEKVEVPGFKQCKDADFERYLRPSLCQDEAVSAASTQQTELLEEHDDLITSLIEKRNELREIVSNEWKTVQSIDTTLADRDLLEILSNTINNMSRLINDVKKQDPLSVIDRGKNEFDGIGSRAHL